MKKILEEYQDYLNQLAKNGSDEIFTNAGIHHASILMATMFKYTQKRIRMYCTGLKPELITTSPYFDEFKKLFNSDNIEKDIQIMIEEESYKDQEPFNIVKQAKQRFPEKIQVRLIKEEDRTYINKRLEFPHCNFAIFDEAKFRLEHDPECYKAIGSFNHKEWADLLIDLYDKAYDSAAIIC